MKRYRVEVIDPAGSGQIDVYTYRSNDDSESVEDVKRHADAYYMAQNCQPERIEAEEVTDDSVLYCQHHEEVALSQCEHCLAWRSCYFHPRNRIEATTR